MEWRVVVVCPSKVRVTVVNPLLSSIPFGRKVIGQTADTAPALSGLIWTSLYVDFAAEDP